MEAVKKFFSRLGKGTAEMFKRMPFFFYILVHPFQGFYDLKVDPKRRNIPGAVFLFVLLAFSAIFKRQLLGYLYTSRADQLNLDIVVEILVAVLPYLMWVIANWCFTSLMDGDGKLVDIFCATAVGIIHGLRLCLGLSDDFPRYGGHAPVFRWKGNRDNGSFYCRHHASGIYHSSDFLPCTAGYRLCFSAEYRNCVQDE